VLLRIAIVVFEAKRLPEISRSLGQALSEFKKG
jgi:TatA/E family protein of Tat protein translocase